MFSLKDTLQITPFVGPILGYWWLTPLVFIAAGLLLGIIFERIVLVRLHKFAERTTWKGDDIVIAGIRGLTTLWFLLLGLYGALLNTALPVRVHAVGTKLLVVVFIFSATLAAAKIAAGLVTQAGAGSEGANVKTASILRIVARIVVFSIGFLIVLQSLGISITPILTALGVGGLAVALALQPTLANLFAGIQIIAAREIVPGDFVRLQSGEDGYIEDITWRNTLIRSLANNIIIVPNDKLATAIVTDFYSPSREYGFVVPVTVAFDTDLEKLERVTLDVAREAIQAADGAVVGHEPGLSYAELGEYGIKFNVGLRVQEYTKQWGLKHQFYRRLLIRYRKEGIEIPYPTRVVRMENMTSET
jgi:small-conductance mechanosensitive channel